MPTQFQRILQLALSLLAILVLALLVLTVVFSVTKFADPPAASPSEDTTGGGETTSDGTPVSGDTANDGVTLSVTPDAGQAYQDRLTFVGDAGTAHMISRGGLSGGEATTRVWRTESGVFNLKPGLCDQKIIFPGPGEYTGTPMTVAKAAEVATPEILVITLGTDWGVSYLSEQDFKACYTDLIQAIQKASPDTVILLQSILPVSAGHPTLSNQRIDLCNKWVKAVAAETGCRYLDTQSVLKNDEGALKSEYAYGGGQYLNADGYAVMLAYIRSHAVTA